MTKWWLGHKKWLFCAYNLLFPSFSTYLIYIVQQVEILASGIRWYSNGIPKGSKSTINIYMEWYFGIHSLKRFFFRKIPWNTLDSRSHFHGIFLKNDENGMDMMWKSMDTMIYHDTMPWRTVPKGPAVHSQANWWSIPRSDSCHLDQCIIYLSWVKPVKQKCTSWNPVLCSMISAEMSQIDDVHPVDCW
jgi:hypothetical protein